MPKKHHAHEGEAHHAAHHAEKSKSIGSLLGSQQAGTIILFLLIGLVVGLALGYMLTSSGQQQGGAQAAMPTQDALKVKLASYLNTNFFSTQGMEAKVKDFNNFDDMFYGFSFDITQDGNVQQTVSDVFVSKDGKMLVVGTPYEKAAFSGQVYLLDVPFPAPQQSEEPTQPAVYPQSDKPEVLLFVWAFCPGGVSGESALKPVVDLLGDNINAKVTFIGAVTSNAAAAANSCFAGRGLSQAEALANCCVKYDNIEGQTVYSCALHNTVGNLQESHESGNQACIQKYYPDKYWGYVAAFNNSCVGQAGDTCWKAEATKLGIDTAKISQCAEGTEGIKMLIADSGTADQYSIGTSPTLMINGVAYDGSTSSSGYKDAICSAFNTPPAECSQAVSAGSSVNTNASCG